MKRAFILHGPSGVGKSTLASIICKKHDYKHCDADEFKFIFSETRSDERTEIGEKIGFEYTKELINRGHNIIIEVFPEKTIKKLKPLLKKNNYDIIDISLKAPLSQCIKNDKTRIKKTFGKDVIIEVYDLYCSDKGHVINVTNKTVKEVYDIIKKDYF